MEHGDVGIEAIADAFSHEQKVLVTAHVKPDGDALGSVIAVHLALEQLGTDSVMYFAGHDPIAPEYLFLSALDQALRGDPPSDLNERTVIALDAGNADRIGIDDVAEKAGRIINIDHHVDNSRFGQLNLVMPDASSTAEIVYQILKKTSASITGAIGEALYTGILVDSGRFQYSSTTPMTLRVAADLIDIGVDHTRIFHNVYENMPLGKAKLLCRMLSALVIRCDGKMAAAVLDEAAFKAAGATTSLTDGLVDNLRAIEGVVVGALIYARTGETDDPDQPHFRVSLRSSDEKVNVQRIAKLKGGGGHVQAAGFSANEAPADLIEFVAQEVGKALD